MCTNSFDNDCAILIKIKVPFQGEPIPIINYPKALLWAEISYHFVVQKTFIKLTILFKLTESIFYCGSL